MAVVVYYWRIFFALVGSVRWSELKPKPIAKIKNTDNIVVLTVYR